MQLQSGATDQDNLESIQDPEPKIVSYIGDEGTQRNLECTIAECIEEPTVSSEKNSKHGRLNRVATTRQTLVNGRIFEQHLDSEGHVVRQIRLRSSGLPYLTDEETDPSSREQSDHSSSDSDQEFTGRDGSKPTFRALPGRFWSDPECTIQAPERKKITWPNVEM